MPCVSSGAAGSLAGRELRKKKRAVLTMDHGVWWRRRLYTAGNQFPTFQPCSIPVKRDVQGARPGSLRVAFILLFVVLILFVILLFFLFVVWNFTNEDIGGYQGTTFGCEPFWTCSTHAQ